MGKLTTHILDATHGCPANDVRIVLYRVYGDEKEMLLETRTNDDGRTNMAVLEGTSISQGVYEFEFYIGDYFRKKVTLAEVPFLDVVPIRFGIDDVNAHYHVPLLASPFSYSTYRGS